MGLLTVSIVAATTTIPVRTILLPNATTTILAITTTTSGSGARSNIFPDYIFHGIYTVIY